MVKNACLLGVVILSYYQGLSQQTSKATADTSKQYFARLIASDNPADKIQLQKEAYKKLESSVEEDWFVAMDLLFELGKKSTVDSIQTAVVKRFPTGSQARYERISPIGDLTDPVKMEKELKLAIKEFPPTNDSGSSNITYDYTRHAIAMRYLDKGNINKAMEYTNQVQTIPWQGQAYALMGRGLMRKGYFKEAEIFARKALNNALEFRTTRKGQQGWEFASVNYSFSANLLATIFLKQKKYAEALKYSQMASDSSRSKSVEIHGNYATILNAVGQHKKALSVLEDLIISGQADRTIDSSYRKTYIVLHGNETGLDKELHSLKEKQFERLLKELPSKMINEPMIPFTLRDTDGKVVSLSDYKGKIVILDFWATWCGPCKASFPAMQMAVDKYINDSTVAFLFIHTWEKGDGDKATAEASKYIKDNKYNFHVLMDLKPLVEGEKPIVSKYKVNGIPAKFILDTNGNIRFKLTGFSGGNDGAVAELSTMVDLIRQNK